MSTPELTKRLVQEAIELLGSEAKLGAACGYSQVAIWKAKHRGSVSAEMAIAIDSATEGKVGRGKLRPDLWPAPTTQQVA